MEEAKCPLGVDPTRLTASIGELKGLVQGLKGQIVPLRQELRDTDAHVNQLNGRFDQFLSDAHQEGGKAGRMWGAVVAGSIMILSLIAQASGAWNALAKACGLQ
jgi:hypothetical protein